MSLFDRTVAGLLPCVPKPLVARFSRPYIAGPRLEDGLALVRSLQAEGMMATLDLLGEDVADSAQASSSAAAYREILEEIARCALDANISIKPTQLGLKLSREVAESNLRAVLAKGRELGIFVRLDMEDSSCVSFTLDLYRAVRRDFENVGVVLQAMLRRSLVDVAELARERAKVRVCKGIYLEPWEVAYQDRELVSRNYVLVLETLLRAGSYVGIATHDERLIWEALRLIHQLRLSREEYEFQMLLGVREDLRRLILREGHRLRVYVPFGNQGQAYALRRLRENPRVAGYVARALLRRR